jgi:hypothetical protein
MIRKSQVAKLLAAQRAFDECPKGNGAARRKTAAIIGAAFRNATPEERQEFNGRLTPSGQVPRQQ